MRTSGPAAFKFDNTFFEYFYGSPAPILIYASLVLPTLSRFGLYSRFLSAEDYTIIQSTRFLSAARDLTARGLRILSGCLRTGAIHPAACRLMISFFSVLGGLGGERSTRHIQKFSYTLIRKCEYSKDLLTHLVNRFAGHLVSRCLAELFIERSAGAKLAGVSCAPNVMADLGPGTAGDGDGRATRVVTIPRHISHKLV
ncbi:hypothetical protein F4604DRAFT_1674697 [Suillus subluteus]|nr:hypothetical protein F4604DRAFT_1674697 [Suillus subluteus]